MLSFCKDYSLLLVVLGLSCDGLDKSNNDKHNVPPDTSSFIYNS